MKRLIKKISDPAPIRSWITDLVLTLPRIAAGLLLAIDFGASKFGMPWTAADRKLDLFEVIYWFPQDVAEYGGIFAAAPVFWAWMGAFSEAVGGLTLALGLQTRVSAFLISCTMLVAVFCQKWGQGTWAMLPALGFLWLGIFFMIQGGGRFSLDQLIQTFFKRKTT